MTSKSSAPDDYSDDAIQALTDREHVRSKLGMYIGSKGIEGLHHIVLEILSNGVDEHLAGFATDIWLEIKKDQTVVIRDNGRGIPIGTAPDSRGEMVPTPQLVATVLKAGGKFRTAGSGSAGYNSSGGTHGIGLKAAAFTSTRFELDIWRDGQHYHQDMVDGAETINAPVIKAYKGPLQGTQITYRYDPDLFAPDSHIDAERVLSKVREISYPCPKLTLHFTDARTGFSETIKAANGIEDLAVHLAGEDSPLFKKPIRLTKTVELPAGHERNWLRDEQNRPVLPAVIGIDVALLPTDSSVPGERAACYTNAIPNPDGGEHLAGVRNGMARAMKAYMTTNSLTKAPDQLETIDILQGLCIAVSAVVPDPSFAGQHKAKLDTAEIAPLFAEFVRDWLADWLPAHEKDAKAWAKSVEEFRIARVEFKKTKQAFSGQNKGKISALTSKLAAHQGAPAEQAELFLVEGDSAGGTAKGARFGRYQAIFPLKGKPLNVYGQKLSRIASNLELAAICQCIGLDLRGEYDPSSIKYGKVVILADADPDGGHIVLLLLQFFLQEFPDMIKDGRLWMIRPALFLAKSKRKGGTDHYLSDDEALARFLRTNKVDDYEIKRFKGLGEMGEPQLRHIAFEPTTRSLFQVTMGDVAYGSELMNGLMGNDSGFKKDWLNRYASELAATPEVPTKRSRGGSTR